jgi:hypothetical protein
MYPNSISNWNYLFFDNISIPDPIEFERDWNALHPKKVSDELGVDESVIMATTTLVIYCNTQIAKEDAK